MKEKNTIEDSIMQEEYKYYIEYTRARKETFIVSYETFKKEYPLYTCPHYIILRTE